MRFADELEGAHHRRMTASQVSRVFSGLVKELTGEEMASATVRGFLDGYLKRRDGELKETSLAGYKGVAKVFLEWLGPAAGAGTFQGRKEAHSGVPGPFGGHGEHDIGQQIFEVPAHLLSGCEAGPADF